MPELPEAQTIVNDLEKKVVGKTIQDFWSDWRKNIRPSFAKFKTGTCGKKIKGVRRIGKHLVLDLSGGNSIVIHLKMIGHFLFKKKGEYNKNFEEKINQYIHHIIFFKNGDNLAMSDMRKFAWMFFVKTDKVEKMTEILQLGPDALDENLNSKIFNELLEKRKNSQIGVAVLDQKWIAGIGNIYRSEILFDAKIHPEKFIKNLRPDERKRLFNSMRKILKKAIKMRGTSTVDYRDTDGKKGGFQNVLKVYGKEGEKCVYCDNKIKRLKLGQRSAFLCEGCQINN
ncbi:MAG: DNA-formamidopyrimidine glycosylase [Patescibacteria group bacterium]